MFKSSTYLLAVASLLGFISAQNVMTQYETLINPADGINELPEIGKRQLSTKILLYPTIIKASMP